MSSSSLSIVLNAVTLVFSLMSLALFIVGAIGFYKIRSVIRSVSWIYSSDGRTNLFVGLRQFYGKVDGGKGFGRGFDDESCIGDFCEACKMDGQGAFGLIIIALLFTALVMGLSAFLLTGFKASAQIANVFASFVAACSALVAVSLFMGDCYEQIKDGTDEFEYLSWGPGSILTTIGMGFMWVVVVLQIVSSAIGSDVAASTASAAPGLSGTTTNRF